MRKFGTDVQTGQIGPQPYHPLLRRRRSFSSLAWSIAHLRVRPVNCPIRSATTWVQRLSSQGVHRDCHRKPGGWDCGPLRFAAASSSSVSWELRRYPRTCRSLLASRPDGGRRGNIGARVTREAPPAALHVAFGTSLDEVAAFTAVGNKRSIGDERVGIERSGGVRSAKHLRTSSSSYVVCAEEKKDVVENRDGAPAARTTATTEDLPGPQTLSLPSNNQ